MILAFEPEAGNLAHALEKSIRLPDDRNMNSHDEIDHLHFSHTFSYVTASLYGWLPACDGKAKLIGTT